MFPRELYKFGPEIANFGIDAAMTESVVAAAAAEELAQQEGERGEGSGSRAGRGSGAGERGAVVQWV